MSSTVRTFSSSSLVLDTSCGSDPRHRDVQLFPKSDVRAALTSHNSPVVYNARKRGEDRASDYFKRTENVAGVKDMRFQALMPDILHWLGITKIDRMLSMSKYVGSTSPRPQETVLGRGAA